MSLYSRVKTINVKELVDKASMKGIFCGIEEVKPDYTTLMFNTENTRHSFESMAFELGLEVLENPTYLDRMIDSVIEGIEPDKLIQEVTRGMINAVGRGKPKYHCIDCELKVPVYPGRYPKNCPICNGNLESTPVLLPSK
jgi:hypothetical protein